MFVYFYFETVLSANFSDLMVFEKSIGECIHFFDIKAFCYIEIE